MLMLVGRIVGWAEMVWGSGQAAVLGPAIQHVGNEPRKSKGMRMVTMQTKVVKVGRQMKTCSGLQHSCWEWQRGQQRILQASWLRWVSSKLNLPQASLSIPHEVMEAWMNPAQIDHV